MATTILICASFLALSVATPLLDSGPQGCEGTGLKVIQADVGGRVCLDSELQDSCKHLYWQRGSSTTQDIFVNGFSTEDLSYSLKEEFKNRSRVNETTRNLELWDLRLSDTAHYVCICYKVGCGPRGFQSAFYHLTVTASFKKPTLTDQLRDDGRVELTCVSSGGFPRRGVQWLVSSGLNSTDWELTNQSEWQDPPSQLWEVKSTVVMNCTQSLNVNVSCAVGSATSEYLEICRPLPPFPPTVLIAIGVLGVLVLGMVIGCVVKILKNVRPTRRHPDGELEHSGTEPLRTTPEVPSSEEETSLSPLTPR